MLNRDLPTEASCDHCGAVAKTRGQIWGRNHFCPSDDLIPLLWIQCPNCGHVTQPVDAESMPTVT
jgi:hypothetical protein